MGFSLGAINCNNSGFALERLAVLDGTRIVRLDSLVRVPSSATAWGQNAQLTRDIWDDFWDRYEMNGGVLFKKEYFKYPEKAGVDYEQTYTYPAAECHKLNAKNLQAEAKLVEQSWGDAIAANVPGADPGSSPTFRVSGHTDLLSSALGQSGASGGQSATTHATNLKKEIETEAKKKGEQTFNFGKQIAKAITPFAIGYLVIKALWG